MTVQEATEKQSIWSARRLAHGNAVVTDIHEAEDFYSKVCGLELVFQISSVNAALLSNGNTHHDMSLVQVGGGAKVGYGSGAKAVQRIAKPSPGHIAFELENEEELVAGWRRAQEAGLRTRPVSHEAAHSVYLTDPEGNQLEIYADVIKDWRQTFNLQNDRVVSSAWSPGETPPLTESRYTPDPEIRRVEGAIFQPRCIGHAVIVASDLENLLRFYTEVVGLHVAYSGQDGSYAVLNGAVRGYDLSLFQATEGRPAGLHHLGFVIEDERELDQSEERLKEAGIEPVVQLHHATKRAIFIKSPDGFLLEFYADRDAPLDELKDLEPGLALYLA